MSKDNFPNIYISFTELERRNVIHFYPLLTCFMSRKLKKKNWRFSRLLPTLFYFLLESLGCLQRLDGLHNIIDINNIGIILDNPKAIINFIAVLKGLFFIFKSQVSN